MSYAPEQPILQYVLADLYGVYDGVVLAKFGILLRLVMAYFMALFIGALPNYCLSLCLCLYFLPLLPYLPWFAFFAVII